MAGKANKKPIFDPLPSDLVQVDRNKYKSEVWQFFAIHKQLLDEPWVVCTKCNEWVSRHGNTTSTTTDQGANFLAAVRLLNEEGVSEEQVRCSCHKLQLSIKNSLEEQHNPQAAALVTLFRAISNNINNSPMLLDALRKHQCNPDTSCVVDITANMDDEDESNDEPSTSTLPYMILLMCNHGSIV
ncbi:hypothetical protein EMCRGX_G010271 [Ephydatia muelleri]|eukprot:Em0003g1539a